MDEFPMAPVMYPSEEGVAGVNMAFDREGNLWVAGAFTGAITFGQTTLDGGAGNTGPFVAKLDPAGNVLFAEQFSTGFLPLGGGGVAVDSAGNAYVTGPFRGTLTIPGNPPGVLATDDADAAFGFLVNAYLVKLDPKGGFVWGRSLGCGTPGTGYAGVEGLGVSVKPSGNLVLQGWAYRKDYPASLDLSGDGGPGTLVFGAGDEGVFAAEYTADGDYVWSVPFEAPAALRPTGYTVDMAGNVYVSGTYEDVPLAGSLWAPGDAGGSVSCDPPNIGGSCEIAYAAKIGPQGDLAWLVPPVAADGGLLSMNPGVAIDPAGNATTVTAAAPNGAYRRLLLTQLDPSGHVVWTEYAGGSSSSTPVITADALGKLFVSGQAYGNVTLGDGYDAGGSPDAEPYFSPAETLLARFTPAGATTWGRVFAGSFNPTAIAIDPCGNGLVLGGVVSSPSTFPGADGGSSVAAGPNSLVIARFMK
jgi:hypothetical protein